MVKKTSLKIADIETMDNILEMLRETFRQQKVKGYVLAVVGETNVIPATYTDGSSEGILMLLGLLEEVKAGLVAGLKKQAVAKLTDGGAA